MTWELTDSLDEFERVAGPHLLSDAVRQTVPLSVLASLREAGMARFGDSAPVFGWHSRTDGTVDGAILQTPPFPLLLASLPPGSVPGLLMTLADRQALPAAVNLDAAGEASFLADWASGIGGAGAPRIRMRLHRLVGLAPPDPAAAGTARLADQTDLGLLIRWHEAFHREAEGAGPEDAQRSVEDGLSHSGIMLWEADGEPVAMASLTRIVAGVARVVGVFTPAAHRRRGYGAAITTAVTQAAQAAGATDVVLFTDVANPTSNALYERLGYRPVEDRVLLELTPGVTTAPHSSS